ARQRPTPVGPARRQGADRAAGQQGDLRPRSAGPQPIAAPGERPGRHGRPVHPHQSRSAEESETRPDDSQGVCRREEIGSKEKRRKEKGKKGGGSSLFSFCLLPFSFSFFPFSFFLLPLLCDA